MDARSLSRGFRLEAVCLFFSCLAMIDLLRKPIYLKMARKPGWQYWRLTEVRVLVTHMNR